MVLLDAIYGGSEFSAGVKILVLVYYMYNITLVSLYNSPSILQTSILRPSLIIRPLDLVPKANFL